MNTFKSKLSFKKMIALSLFGCVALANAETYSELPVENVQVNSYTQVSEEDPFMKIWGDGQNALHPSNEFPPQHQYSYALIKWDLTKLKQKNITSAKIICTTAGIARALGSKLPSIEAYLASGHDFELDSLLNEEKKLSDGTRA